jgi:hypothetical protein
MLLHGLSRMRAWQPDSFKQQLLDAVVARLAPLQQQQQRAGTRAVSSAGSSEEMLSLGSLPLVLVCLKQLRVPVPTELLQAIEAQLGQQQASAHPSTGQLCLTLFALGASRHAPEPAFLQAAVAQLDAQPEPCSSRDAAHALYGLAAMAAASLSCREVLATQQEQLQRLLLRAEQVWAWCWRGAEACALCA